MIGFETIGNATITVFDNEPILVTDPWIAGNPYFGSWGHKYKIPNQHLENIKKAKYVWLSHGHPDHIDPDSLDIFKDKTFLIASHYGDRIYNDLKKKFKVIKIANNKWLELSQNIRIKTFADWNQDSSLIIEINKDEIIFNLNDGQALGWSGTIKNIIKKYKYRFLLTLVSWGDADMINFYKNNHFVEPHAALKKPCGETYSYLMKNWNCNYALPFSSMHKYTREDSAKMNKYITPLHEHFVNFDNKRGELLPAFINWDSVKKDYFKINPEINNDRLKSEKIYGDNWSDNLDNDDKKIIEKYFKSFEHLKSRIGFLNFQIGKSEMNIKLSERKEGISFSCPRNSFMFAINNSIFDDLLIGNYMKVELIGLKSLYPDFTPFVTKYGDNGGSKSDEELKKYFEYYKMNSINYWKDLLMLKTEDKIRASLDEFKSAYYIARKIRRLLPL